jgi:long-chain acyl-CoA synthetase
MPHVGESLIVERKGGLVALVAKQADEKLSNEELAAIMAENRAELNSRMPAYSKISAIEILEGGFEHTPKQSIKRFLYN